MKVDFELYVRLLEKEVHMLTDELEAERAHSKNLVNKITDLQELIPDTEKRQGASRDSAPDGETFIEVDTSKMSEETRRHVEDHIPKANAAFNRMHRLLDPNDEAHQRLRGK